MGLRSFPLFFPNLTICRKTGYNRKNHYNYIGFRKILDIIAIEMTPIFIDMKLI